MAIDSLKMYYQQGFAARLGALEEAERELHEKAPEAIGMVRRIAHSLYASRDTIDNPEVTQVILDLEREKDENLPVKLHESLSKLRQLAASPDIKRAGILIVDDDSFLTDALKARLGGAGREIFTAKDIAEAERIIDEKDVVLVVLDIMLPDSDGRNLLVRLRERFQAPSLPIVVLSGKKDPQVQMECFALGADAFFQKPVDPLTLSTALSAYLQRSADFTRRSARDPLTELPNREAFNQAFVRANSLASRTRKPLAVAILDIDRFKSVNDLYGHSTGDLVLRRVCAVIAASLRASDFLARWGGEEFVILFSNTDIQNARLALGKALKALRAEGFQAKSGQRFAVTFSAGIAEVRTGDNLEQVLSTADKLLFRAKALGRNQIITGADVFTKTRQKILLIGDDDATVSGIQRPLERIGLGVLHAADPQSAFDVASRAGVCLIVLDAGLRGSDGFDLLKAFRRIPSFAQVPILVLTEQKGQHDVVRAFQSGADDCVAKPIVPQELSARVLRLLK